MAIHSDCAQSIGKIPVTVPELGVDLLSVCGHKVSQHLSVPSLSRLIHSLPPPPNHIQLYAPKGIGALYIRRGITLQKLMHGADHESGKRAGTENILEITGLGKAMEIAARDLEKNMRWLPIFSLPNI